MGFEAAHQAMDTQPISTPVEQSNPGTEGAQSATPTDNGSLAPDSGKPEVLDLGKTEKFMWEGKEMTPEELRKSILRQQDYTKKTQEVAEQRRKFEEERRSFVMQQEETEKYNSNLDADIQNVLRNPALEAKFKEIYPPKYHAALEKALGQTFGEQGAPNRSDNVLEQRLKSIENQFMTQNMERQKTAFESEVKANAEILDSTISRLSTKYPNADEDSVLARAEYMASGLKKDASFNDSFSQIMEKLYKENHEHHEKRYQEIYKQKVETQKQANTRGRDIGKGGATPATAPTKLKLKDVKNHILSNLGQ